MSMIFDKRLSQEYIYNIDNSLRDDPTKKHPLSDYHLSTSDVVNLNSKITLDGVGFYYNSLVSFLSGCLSIKENSVSWGCIEIYYSLYYCIRSILYFNNYALIRDKKGSLILINNIVNYVPTIKSHKKYNSDHEGTINYYADVFGETDYMLTNKFEDDMSYYEWMRNIREITNYRQNVFLEPDSFDLLNIVVTQIKKNKLDDLLKTIKNDWDLYCFSPKYALISGIYKKLSEAADLYFKQQNRFSDEQTNYLKEKFRLVDISQNVYENFIVL